MVQKFLLKDTVIIKLKVCTTLMLWPPKKTISTLNKQSVYEVRQNLLYCVNNNMDVWNAGINQALIIQTCNTHYKDKVSRPLKSKVWWIIYGMSNLESKIFF